MIRDLAIIAGRAMLGLGLAAVLAMAALAVAWGLYIFIGASSSRTTFMIMSMTAAGLGSGIAANLAWLKLDRNQRSVIAVTLLLAIAGASSVGWSDTSSAPTARSNAVLSPGRHHSPSPHLGPQLGPMR
jgi:hypothetical protein